MQNSSAFQYLAIDTIHESATNPRRTFEESKLQELAESIRHHGLIQPVTVRPNADGFELIAGARRYRAAQLAAHIDRELAARPDLVQIENGWRSAREQRPGAVQRGHFREIEAVAENPDAEPVTPCAAAKAAIIVCGKRA